MSQQAWNSPQPGDSDATPSDNPTRPPQDNEGPGVVEPRETAQDAQSAEPHDSASIGTGDGTASNIRVGSPFAEDPFDHDASRPIENLYDVGPLRYTAMGAVSASVVVLAFSGLAAYFFPPGGTIVAALGCLLSIFGMYSSFRLAAAGLLVVHLCLFLVSYSQTFS